MHGRLLKTILKHMVTALAIIALTAVLSGCETMHGLGSDIQGLGHWVQDKAE